MFFEYIQAAISKAVYEVIDDEEPYYGEVFDLKGVWATGKTQEECRENLRMAIEDWIAFSLQFNLPISEIVGQAYKSAGRGLRHVQAIPRIRKISILFDATPL